MLISMMLKQNSPEQREIVRGFVKHALIGFACGFTFGAVLYALILMAMSGTSIQIPALFALAMLLQAGALGGLVGMGVYMSRISERDDGADPGISEEDPTAPEPVRAASPAPAKPAVTPAGATGQPA